VQTELKISALIETGGEKKTLRDTHLSKDRNSGTGNETKERRYDPRQAEKISPRATATSRKISDRSGKHRQTTQAHKPRPTGAHSTKTSTSKSLPALVAAKPERKNKALLKS
jgi:hypothetical protein